MLGVVSPMLGFLASAVPWHEHSGAWSFLSTCSLCVVALAGLWLAYRIVYSYCSYDLDRIPGPWKHALPILGNALSLLRLDVHRQLLAWSDQYGGIYRGQLLWHESLVVTDPAVLTQICGRGEGWCDKASYFYHALDGMPSRTYEANLLTGPSDALWHTVRKAVAQSFAFGTIKRKMPVILERVDAMLTRLHALGPDVSVDMDGMALRLTLDVLGLAAFDHAFNSIEQPVPPPAKHLLSVLPHCFLECMVRLVNPAWRVFPGLAPLRASPGGIRWATEGVDGFREFQHQMEQLLDGIAAKGAPAKDDTDLGAQLYRLVYEGQASRERILSELGILFFEGYETTGHTISWALLHAVIHDGVQDKIAAELDSLGLLAKAGHPAPRRVGLDDLPKLKYLTACVKESMRITPVVAMMTRTTLGPTHVGPYVVPKNIPIVTPLFCIHNTRHNWSNPEKFRPERWMRLPLEAYVAGPGVVEGAIGGVDARGKSGLSNAESKAGGGAKRSDGGDDVDSGSDNKVGGICFMPFSEGPRNCVGQNLAKLEMMVVLASIFANFTLRLAPEMGGIKGIRKREATLLTLQTGGKGGLSFNLQPRGKA